MKRPILDYCRIVMTMLAALLAPGYASAFGTFDDQAISPLVAEFNTLDRNHNGYLSHEEANRDHDIATRFEHADSNRDGRLDEHEFTEIKSNIQMARMELFLEDSTVTAKIKAELLKDNGIRGLSISVETHRGQVILSGFVDREEQIRRASEIASGVRGVTSVKNSLILKG